MFVAELWRYPIKSLRGESLPEAELLNDGVRGDRGVVVISSERKRVITARTHPGLLGLQVSLGPDGHTPSVDGLPWDSPAATSRVEQAAGEAVSLVKVPGEERFDVLPLLVATDGAIKELAIDGRRLRPNIVVGGVSGRLEREWPGKVLAIGEAVIRAAQLRQRCIMTTYDPDTLEQNRSVLFRIVSEFDGQVALDCSVVRPGKIGVGDTVQIAK